MKKKQWLEQMSLVDEKYIEEADPLKKRGTQRKLWIRFGMLAACLALVMSAGGVWLLLGRESPPTPIPPEPSPYADSEYYEVIRRIDAWVVEASKQNDKNSSNKVDENGSSSLNSYVEVTDNQVAGVIEGDIMKRTEKYIFFLGYDCLKVCNIDGENTQWIGSYLFKNYSKESALEFYLSQDGKTVTVIFSKYATDISPSYTIVRALDVSDPTNIREKAVVTIDGFYKTSRMVDGTLLLFTNYGLYGKTINYNDPETFVPMIQTNEKKELIAGEDIVTTDTALQGQYTVVALLSEDSLALEGSHAFLAYSGDIYISPEMFCLSGSYRGEHQERMTEIVGVNYQDRLEVQGKVHLAGTIKNRYSMDIYQGILRVVTTTNVVDQGKTSASLYCVDLNTWKVISAVDNFAPLGESVQSARFDKGYAYVCTALTKELIDPVFFFDLSDPKKITYKDTGDIPGYSTSLTDFHNGNLLGIGLGDRNDILKIELFKEGEKTVESICSYEQKKTRFSSEYKDYYIDRERQLIGLGVMEWSDEIMVYYILFHFDGTQLTPMMKVPIGEPFRCRAVYIDEYVYILSNSELLVQPLEIPN